MQPKLVLIPSWKRTGRGFGTVVVEFRGLILGDVSVTCKGWLYQGA